jgi:hypothetical protein
VAGLVDLKWIKFGWQCNLLGYTASGHSFIIPFGFNTPRLAAFILFYRQRNPLPGVSFNIPPLGAGLFI